MSAHTAESGKIDSSVWKVAIVAVIGPFMTQVDSTVVNVSLSTINDTLGSSIATAQWIVSGYLLAMALMLPMNGWLVDRLGAKRIYMSGFALFTLASMLCGASQTMGELIAARVFQGLVGGVLAPMTQMMIARVAGNNMARVMGYATLPILLGPVVGPVLAGTILAHGSWPWLFYLNVPVGILGVALAAFLLPRDTVSSQNRPFDFIGFGLISPGLVALIYGLQDAHQSGGRWILATGAILLAAFVGHSLNKRDAALIDIRIFADRTFSFAALTQFFANGMMFGRQLVVPLFLIGACGLSATHAGEFIAATGIGMMCSFPCVGFLSDRFGCRAVSAGGAFIAMLSTVAFLVMSRHGFSEVWGGVGLFLAGVGQGTISIPSISAAYSSIPKPRLPVANTALNIAQRVGGPVATTLLGAVVASTVVGVGSVRPGEFTTAFVVLTGLHVLALGAAALLPARLVRRADR